MLLNHIILAESAAAIEGKVFIHGGGITRIIAARLPWVEPQLAVAMAFTLDPAEDEGDHEMELQVVAPSRELVVSSAAGAFYVPFPESLAAGEPWTMNVALTMTPLSFFEAGPHAIRIVVDGHQLGTSPFGVTVDEGLPAHQGFHTSDIE